MWGDEVGVHRFQLECRGNRRTWGHKHMSNKGLTLERDQCLPDLSSATCSSGGVLKTGRRGFLTSQDRGELVTLKAHSHSAVDSTCGRPEGWWPVPAEPGTGNADSLVGSPDRDLWSCFHQWEPHKEGSITYWLKKIGLQTDLHWLLFLCSWPYFSPYCKEAEYPLLLEGSPWVSSFPEPASDPACGIPLV